MESNTASSIPLLSICIPTYNGAKRIESTLSYLVEGLKLCSSFVEIVIADNHSDDETEMVVHSFNPNLPNIRYKYYKYSKNIGYNNSVKRILQDIATGVYVWLIGDDDYINPQVIPLICQILQKNQYDYVHLNHLIAYNNLEIDQTLNISRFQYYESPMYVAIDKNCKDSDLIATFMSSSIGRLDPIKEFDFSIFNSNTWTDFRSVFPVSYIMISLFFKSKCLLISTPCIVCMVHEKSWDNKIPKMKVRFLPELLNEYERNYGMQLPNNRYLISSNIIITLLRYPYSIKYLNFSTLHFIFDFKIYRELCIRFVKRLCKK